MVLSAIIPYKLVLRGHSGELVRAWIALRAFGASMTNNPLGGISHMSLGVLFNNPGVLYAALFSLARYHPSNSQFLK